MKSEWDKDLIVLVIGAVLAIGTISGAIVVDSYTDARIIDSQECEWMCNSRVRSFQQQAQVCECVVP